MSGRRFGEFNEFFRNLYAEISDRLHLVVGLGEVRSRKYE